jgi:hypothetical protein
MFRSLMRRSKRHEVESARHFLMLHEVGCDPQAAELIRQIAAAESDLAGLYASLAARGT